MATLAATPWSLLLDRRDLLLEDLAFERGLGRRLAQLTLAMAAGAALYGGVLGSWQGGTQALYAAVKLPLVLVATSALTLVFNSLVARLLGLPLRFGQTAVLTFFALAAASLPLASLAPVAWFFTVSFPPPGTEARLAHNLLYLLHTAFVGGCGLAGTAALWRVLARLCPGAPRLKAVFAVWLLTFALVGGEVAWALRPFVGSVYEPAAFLRADALDGNVYEFMATDIAPYLMERLGEGD
jgi:hypothetical protein